MKEIGVWVMRYFVLKCSICDSELNKDSYGIMLLGDDNSREYFCDISDRVDDINKLVRELNEFRIEPCHLKSVIEDYKYTSNRE